MNKHIILICEGGQQFGLVVPELSASKVTNKMFADINTMLADSTGKKQFICVSDYMPSEDPNQEMYVKAKIVNTIVIVGVSDIVLPAKHLVSPTGDKLN